MSKLNKTLAAVLSAVMLCTASIPALAAAPTSLVTVRTDFSDTAIPSSTTVLQYSGKGDTVIPNINLPAGIPYKVTCTHDGSRNFIINFYDGDYSELLLNEIGPYAGTSILESGYTTEKIGSIFEIKADGNWTLAVSTVSNLSTRSMTGSGSKVTGIFELPAKNTIATMNHTGTDNFIVWAYYSDGDYQLIANEIGDYSGQAVLRNKQNVRCYLVVTSSGQWAIDLGYGDAVSLVPDIN